jgi:Lon protease-like protein
MVLLPKMRVPLHIFEERYREMVDQCLENNQPFGIVYYNGSNFRSAGCSAGIIKLIKRYDDGRKDILIEGKKRFYLESIDDSGLYLKSTVRYFDDCGTENAEHEAQRLKDEAIDLFSRLAELNNKSLDREFLQSMDPGEFSFLLSASDLFNVEERQESLESSSTANRIQNLITSAKRSIRRSEANQKLLEILGDNSDIRHIFN